MLSVQSATERTALIILLFSNESVDADGSVLAHKMHGTGCICEFLLHLPVPLALKNRKKII